MRNFLDSVKGTITNVVIDKAADALGIENNLIKSGMKMFLPAIIGGIVHKGSHPSGAGRLLDIFKKERNLDDFDLLDILSNKDKTHGWLSRGDNLLSSVFGNNMSNRLVDFLVNLTGMKKGIGSTLLKFLAPIVLGKLAGISKEKNFDAHGLASYLGEQKDVFDMVPGLSSLFEGGKDVASTAIASHTTTHKSTTTHYREEESTGGGGWWKWIIPLLLLGGLAWMLTKGGCEGDHDDDDHERMEHKESSRVEHKAPTTKAVTTENTTHTTTETTHAGTTAKVGYSMDAKGNIINSSGNIIYKKGDFKLDDKGNLVDMSGKILVSAASLPSDLIAKLKAALGGMSNGVTQQQMTELFTNMIVRKPGAKTSYALSKVQFDKSGHKVVNFSKAEVLGLAAALKANAKGKIIVEVYTNDGKNDSENKKLSKDRAQVIKDWFTTLGIKKSQVDAKGMGSGTTKVVIRVK